MIRRKFLQMMTVGGVSGVLPLASLAAAKTSRTATYLVKGFSCVTCATGLDTLLGQQEGVISSHSTYPEGKVTVRFDPARITEPTIMAFIAELGFTPTAEGQRPLSEGKQR